jgi:hypothetical protein
MAKFGLTIFRFRDRALFPDHQKFQVENQPYVAKSLYINVILFQKMCVYESSHSIDKTFIIT